MILQKKIKCLFQIMFIMFLFFNNNFAQNYFDFDKLNNSHDLSLPDWGPYTKRYIGISHIPKKESGIRFDLSVFPGFYRRKVEVPNVLFENNYHPWETSSNFEYFCFRHELEWKDKVYTDISYSKYLENARLIRIECVNNTELNQNLAVHFMASINFPPLKEYSPYTSLYPAVISLPSESKWIDAIDYKVLDYANPRPQDNLVYDGKMRGEIRASGFVNGSGIGNGFGKDKGDFVSYKFLLEHPYKNAVLYIRYRLSSGKELTLQTSGILEKNITLKGNYSLKSNINVEKINISGAHNTTKDLSNSNSIDNFSNVFINIGNKNAGEYELNITSNGGNEIEIDGFSIIESEKIDKIKIDQKIWNPVPKIISGPVKNSIILKYDDVDLYYGIIWQSDIYDIRQWFGRDIGDYFKQMANEHVAMSFEGEGEGHFTNIFIKPIELEPHSSKNIYGAVCSGNQEEVFNTLNLFYNARPKYEEIYLNAKSSLTNFSSKPEGEKYKFSIEKLNATLNSNVVYPVYTQKEYIKHSAPGRWWDCLYTWDSGFIGLGLLQSNVQKAVENLNAYLLPYGSQSAFIHHGSPVPVQFYLFLELWNKTQSKEMLEYFYPRLKQYHEFLAGRLGSSTTNSLNSNLLKTWDYFYNSGGWDDYPPQKFTHDNLLEKTVTPVINTAHAIRTAKILKMAADYLGKTDDIESYNSDIDKFSKALQENSWDNESGYFSYVIHDSNGNPSKFLKYEDGTNFNMGLDGAYPLVSGICDNMQIEKLTESLKSEKQLWSKIGLSAVDQSAPYYRIDGYWNGTVWIPHQWFFWKTMLDLAESDFAYKIAITALNLWKVETEATYNSMEHFIINTGRGAGWHEFGGLSSPLLLWYSAYFIPGNFTAGFDIWIDNKKWSDDFSELSVTLKNYGSKNDVSSVIACMNPNFNYIVKWNNKEIKCNVLTNGTLSIDINFENEDTGILKVLIQ